MMMPSQPLAPLVVVLAHFFFQFAIVLLDPPTSPDDANPMPQPRRLGVEWGQPILRGLLLRLGPLDQQPFVHARRMGPFAPAVRHPNREAAQSGPLGTLAALPPHYGPPTRRGQLLRLRLQPLGPRQRLQMRIVPGPSLLFSLGQRQGKVWIGGPNRLGGLDLHGVGEAALPQRLPDIRIISLG
jgi:hypothetical protein